MNFNETKQQIFEKAKESGKRTFSESTFNGLTSAMMNEPDYEVTVSKRSKDGTVTTDVIKPIADFREKVIGSIAKQAGVDKDETEKLVKEYKFSADTPWYPVVSEAVTNSLEAGKAFAIIPKNDMEATFSMQDVAEAIKMNGAPGAPESEKKPVVYGKHRVIKCSSGCPKHLRKSQ